MKKKMSKFILEVVKNDYLSFNIKVIENVFPEFKKDKNFFVSEDIDIIKIEWKDEFYNVLANTDLYKIKKVRKTSVFFFYKSVDNYAFNHSLKTYDTFKCDNPIKIIRQEQIDKKTGRKYEDFCVSTHFNSDALKQYQTILYWIQCLDICNKILFSSQNLQTMSLQSIIDSNQPIPYKQMCSMKYVNLQNKFIHTVVFVKRSEYESGKINEWSHFESIEYDEEELIKPKIVRDQNRSILNDLDYAHFIYKILF